MVRLILCSLALTLIQCYGGFANSQDSLVRFAELHFTSDFERGAFNRYFKNNDKDQYLPLLMAVSAAASNTEYDHVKTRIDGVNNLLLSTGIEKKKPEKKIKAVYDQVHATLLKKYEMENRFYEIFTSGNYNCVTATALYSLVFEDLKIPYEIKEEPTHVYLLAYPNAGNILVETTAPLFGFITFNQEFKEKFVSNLKNQKLISDTEASQKTTEELFNTYFFKNEKIDLRKLIGIHYMNDALFRNDHHKVMEAYEQVQKAYFFYPSERCSYLLMNFGAQLVNDPKMLPKEKSKFIAQVARFKDQGITTDMIKGEFSNLTQNVLFRDNNKNLYRQCFETLIAEISDAELISEINYIYYYENGRLFYNQGNYIRARSFFQKALEYQPNNVELGALFVNVVAMSFRNEKNKVSLDSLTSYQTRFPALTENNNFNTMVALANVIQFGEEYRAGNVSTGEKYRAVFEKMYLENKNLNAVSSVVGGAYSSACTYYFKKGNKSKAKAILEKGLEIAPDSYELRSRQQMIH